jgi:polyferredoxin
LPASSSGLLAAAIAGSFLPDLFGVLSGAFAASLLMAFAMLGFAVLHAITRGMSGRAVVLIAVYFAAVVLGWPVLAMALLGLAEAAFNIRNRVARKRGPPSLRT